MHRHHHGGADTHVTHSPFTICGEPGSRASVSRVSRLRVGGRGEEGPAIRRACAWCARWRSSLSTRLADHVSLKRPLDPSVRSRFPFAVRVANVVRSTHEVRAPRCIFFSAVQLVSWCRFVRRIFPHCRRHRRRRFADFLWCGILAPIRARLKVFPLKFAEAAEKCSIALSLSCARARLRYSQLD